jgi:Carboxypeptidase regulatory-like domain
MRHLKKKFLCALFAFSLNIHQATTFPAIATACAPKNCLTSCHGTVVDGNGKPVADLTVLLRVKGSTSIPIQTITDTEGRFSFDGVARELYQLSFSSQTIIFTDCASRLFNCRLREIDLRSAEATHEVPVKLDSSAAMLEGEIIETGAGNLLLGATYLVIRRADDYYKVASIPAHDHFKILVPSSTDLALTLFSDTRRVWVYRNPVDHFATISLDRGITKHLRIVLEATAEP